ncbi:hypothetical protein OPT61_g223 [Boeremia exigua]|uniref:Uncharacterized protein n=1 Tax=Boeremia exigua TaxID=749465 RepID=A0ACC2IUL7_9PLEO|nr:hypothetical protein OPT61_g223 [Boeremia exigua]
MSDPRVYTISWICAISTEANAARAFLDEKHEGPESIAINDDNTYTLGKIGNHFVVIAVLPDGKYGTVSAASVASSLLHSFPNVRVGLMVGIGGGAPSSKHDIRLGDVVVSAPRNDGTGGVFQYDFGKTMQHQKFLTTGYLNQAPTILRTAVADLRARYEADGYRIAETIDTILDNKRRLRKKYGKPEPRYDRLYKSTIVHPEGVEVAEQACASACSSDPADLVLRKERDEDEDDPTIHYGLIASANQIMKNAQFRDGLAKERGVLCFEMEAAGLMNQFPCIAIRGICDYSDTHKNKDWQGYAAMTAAAYAKDLLLRIHPNRIEAEKKLGDLVSALKDTLDDHREIPRQHVNIVQDAARERLSDRQKECLQLFRLTESTKDTTYESTKRRVEDRVAGTCKWVLEHENFRVWSEKESGPLLISADPGCGKSVLAKYLIDDVLPRTSTICYFFFKDPDQSTVQQALCALLHQLFCQKPFLIEHAMGRFDQNGKSLANSTECLLPILENAVNDSRAGAIITVIDALDECVGSALRDLLDHIEKQCHKAKASNRRLMYLFTTRPYDPIISDFRSLFSHSSRIHIPGEFESERISREVNLVIKHRVRRLAQTECLKDEIKEALADRLLEVSHRTYLWVYLVFDYLRDNMFKKTKAGVAAAISKLPKGVNSAYENILSRSKDCAMARKALAIILVAKRPLTIAEMNVALNVEPRARCLDDIDLESHDDFLKSLRSWCGLFISVHEGNVYLLHHTAREFLLADLSAAVVSNPRLRWHQSMNIRQAGKELTGISLVGYAARQWTSHFRESIESEDADIISLAIELLRPCFQLYQSWIWVHFHSASRQLREDDTDFVTELGVASYFGLQEVVECLFQDGHDGEVEDGAAKLTPLLWAIYRGHYGMVKLLLDNGAEVNTMSNASGNKPLNYKDHIGSSVDRYDKRDVHLKTRVSALELAIITSYAVEGTSTKIVQLLLHRGANIDTLSEIYGTPLGAAAHKGNKEVVELLLKNSAWVNKRSHHYGSALGAAAFRGFCEIVRILLEYGADTSIMGLDETKPLYLASRHNHVETVRLLLRYNANPDITNAHGWTPLATTSKGAYVDLVELLLEHNTDPNFPCRNGWTPLLLAAEEGHQDVVKILLDSGANWSIKNTVGWKPLDLAFNLNRVEVVDMLLERGAEFTPSLDGWTPLHSAASRGYTEMLRLLLNKGADIAKIDNRGWTPLHAAWETGHCETGQMLLKKDAGLLFATDYSGRTPLHVAIDRDRFEFTKLLLQNEISSSVPQDDDWPPLPCGPFPLPALDVNNEAASSLNRKTSQLLFATTEAGFTPLHLAAVRGDLRMMELLLAKSESILAAATNDGFTPMHLAIANGHLDVVSLLITKDVDITTVVKYRWSSLKLALDYNHIEIAKRLLEADHYTQVGGLDQMFGTIANLFAVKGHTDLLRFCEERNPGSLNLADSHNRTPLHMAAQGGYLDTYFYVARQNLNQLAVDAKGDDLLCFASSGGSLHFIQNLLNDCTPPHRQKGTWSPLHWACRAGDADVVEELFARRYKCEQVTVPDLPDIWTPLAIAVFHGHGTMVAGLSEPCKASLGAKDWPVNTTGGLRLQVECDGCFHGADTDEASQDSGVVTSL